MFRSKRYTTAQAWWPQAVCSVRRSRIPMLLSVIPNTGSALESQAKITIRESQWISR